jgi:hypothetical protein
MITNVAKLGKKKKNKTKQNHLVSHLILAAIYKYEVSTFIIPGGVGWATTHWVIQ